MSYTPSGLENIYQLTKTNRLLSIFLEAHDGETRTANYSSFHIDGAETKYLLHVSFTMISLV